MRGVHRKLYSLFLYFCCIILRIEAVLNPSTARHFRGSEVLFPDPKSYLRHLVIVLKRLEARAFWGVFGPSWEPLGPSWGVLAYSWGVFGPSWEPFGASWLRVEASWVVIGALWPSRAPFGTILESSWGVRDRCGDVLARPWGGLGPSWGILRASWPPLGASCGRLGSNSKENLDFRSIFDPNFDPRNLKNQAPAAGRARCFKNRFWK